MDEFQNQNQIIDMYLLSCMLRILEKSEPVSDVYEFSDLVLTVYKIKTFHFPRIIPLWNLFSALTP